MCLITPFFAPFLRQKCETKLLNCGKILVLTLFTEGFQNGRSIQASNC
jgi:hypothetical protein